MARYVALLRGINVGGRIVKMADLKACFEALGLASVMTVLQSGNVLFESAADPMALRPTIESGLTARFGYAAKIQLVPLDRLQRLIEAYPFDDSDARSQHYVLFFDPGLAERLAGEARNLEADIEAIRPGDGVLYWRVRKGMTLKSPFSKYLVKAAYRDHHTNRNLNTLRKLAARA